MSVAAPKPSTTWHPLWCRLRGCDGENHLGHETRWQPASDDVTVSIRARRWDEGQRGTQRYHRGVPKVTIDFENLANSNIDGCKIQAEAHFDATELRLLIRFLKRELGKITHFEGDSSDMPVDVSETAAS